MELKFINNFRFLKVIKATKSELDKIKSITCATYYDRPANNTQFINLYENGIMPSGFFGELLKLNKEGYSVKILNIKDYMLPFKDDDFNKWLVEQDLNYEPYEYQYDSLVRSLQFRHARLLLDTSAGKSFIIYLYSLYILKERQPNKKILIIVPRTLLVTQLPLDFKDYSDNDFIKCEEVMGGFKNKKVLEFNKTCNVVVGNIASLVNKPFEYFKQFSTVIIDEAHSINNKSTESVMNALNLSGVSYVLGMSGTFEDENNGSKEINEVRRVRERGFMGSILIKLYLEDLKKYGSIAPCKINIVKFNASERLSKGYYNHIDCQDKQTRFLFECNYTQGIKKFRDIVNNVIIPQKHNQVALFNTKDFLHQMANECIELCKLKGIEKDIFIIDGDTKKKDRSSIIERMNASDNAILFSMYSILSTGVSIKSLTAIHLVDSCKSFIRIRQSIGRILRLHKSKTFAQVFDYSTTYKKINDKWGGGKTNSYSNQLKDRIFIYLKRKLEYKTLNIELDGISEYIEKESRYARKIREKLEGK